MLRNSGLLINVAVLVVKCCESHDCLRLMLLFWWLNNKYVAELGIQIVY